MTVYFPLFLAPACFQCVGIYFGASWCGPCQQFTKEVVNNGYYEQLQQAGVEIIFVSSDGSQEDTDWYYLSAKVSNG